MEKEFKKGESWRNGYQQANKEWRERIEKAIQEREVYAGDELAVSGDVGYLNKVLDSLQKELIN